MGKKNRQKQGSPSKRSPTPLKPPEPQPKRIGALLESFRLKSAIVALIGILGTFATFYGLRPQPVVVSNVSLNDENPFESQFSIMNNGSIDMQNVRFICFLKSIKTNVMTINNGYAPIAKFPRISASDTVTLPSFKAQIPSSIITESDIAIVVKYRPSFYPWRVERIFRLVTLKASPKGFKWVQQPVDATFIKELRDTENLHRDRIAKGGWD